MRVRAHHFQLRDNEYVPFIETDAADAYRQVALVAQPGSQEAFLAAPEREVLLSGPRGTGKTLSLLVDFFAEVGAGWGGNWKGILIRQSMTGFPEIRSLCTKVIPLIWPNARFNQNQNLWTWSTGETLKLAYFDETSDYRTYIGQSFTWIGFEELTQYRNDQPYKQMLACLRSAMPNIPMRVRSTTNPDGPGHNWVRRRFKTTDPNGTTIGPRIEDEHGLPRRAIYATLAENQLLLTTQPDYLANIVASAIRPGQLEAWTKGVMDHLIGWHVRRRLARSIEALRAAADPSRRDPAVVANHGRLRLGRFEAVRLDLGGDQRRLADRPSRRSRAAVHPRRLRDIR
jgi:hypothetical protein